MTTINKCKNNGFTILQIVIFIGIIGLIILFFSILLSRERRATRDHIRVSSIKQTQAALELFYSQNGSYPANTDKPTTGGSGHNWLPNPDDTGINNTFKSFMPIALTAPLPADSSICKASAPCHNDTNSIANDFCYTAYPEGCSTPDQIKCTGYSLDFCIATQVGDLAPGVHQITNEEIK